jgi:hypothetical protein
MIDRKLSLAIQIGLQQQPPRYAAEACSDTLGAAFLGSCYGDDDLSKFYRLCATSSEESIIAFVTRGLQRKFPHMSRRVSSFDSQWTQRRGLIDILHRQCPQLVRIGRGGKRLDPTIFALIVGLEEKLHWPKLDIATFLGRQSL